MANAIPIPQGAQIGDDPAAPAGVPIPDGAQIGDAQQPAAPTATISARPGGVGQWLQDLEGDIRTGGGATLPGRALQKMGAKGLNVGSQAAAGDFMGSAPLGLTHAAQGVTEVPSHPITGLGHIVGGLLEASTIPGGFMAPEATEGAAALADKGASKVIASPELKQTAAGVVPKVSEALHTVLDNVAQEVGAPASAETSLSKKAGAIADTIKTQAQGVYKQLDDLSGGRFQRFRDTISDLEDVLKNKANVDPEAVAKARERLGVAQDAFEEVKQQLVQSGVDPNTIRQADGKWAQAKSLEDFSKKLRTAESLSGDLKPGTSSLDTGIKNLKPGRLERAVGAQGAGDVRSAVIQGGKDVAKAKTDLAAVTANQKKLGYVGGGALVTALGGKAVSVAKDALSGH